MEAKGKERDIIMKMEILERFIGQLYKTYAKKFSRDSQFWMQLSKEEEEHANCIKELNMEVVHGNLSFDEKRFKLKAIQTTIQYIQKKIKQSIDSQITEQGAYITAWDIENGLLEKNFFKTFKTDQHSVKGVLNKLIHDTEEHRNRIQNRRDNQ